MFVRIPNNARGTQALLKRFSNRFGAVSALQSSEELWVLREGALTTAAFCLFHRKWESEMLHEPRWGLKWAASRSLKDLTHAVGRLPDLFHQLGASSVAARVTMGSHPFIQILEDTDFHYVGGLVILKMIPRGQDHRRFLQNNDFSIRKAKKVDLPRLTQIGHEAFREGRFYHEPGLKKGAAKKIYGVWAKNALNYADVVRVVEGRKLLGFISLKKDKDLRRWWVDLIAVAPGFQGQGIGRLLVLEGKKTALGLKDWDLGVKTEPENLLAFRFYLKNGFEVESFQLDYIWRKKSKKTGKR